MVVMMMVMMVVMMAMMVVIDDGDDGDGVSWGGKGNMRGNREINYQEIVFSSLVVVVSV